MSILRLTARKKGDQTIITDSYFTAPLKIANPFYYKDHTEVMMMAASAGILEGDSYHIEINVEKGAFLKFTSQSYQKIFKAENKGAFQDIKINIESGGSLIYMPYPTNQNEKSIFDTRLEVRMKSDSRFIMTDIISCGRAAMNERFLFTSYRGRTAVYIDDKLCFLDNQKLKPDEANLSGIGFFENHTHTGMLYAYGFNPEIKSTPHVESAVSNALKGICVRAISDSADNIWNCFKEAIK